MSNEILNSLLKEYEQKKLRAEMDVEVRKEKLYKDIPRLNEIEQELSSCSISTAKSILNHESWHSIDSLKDKQILNLLEHNTNSYGTDYVSNKPNVKLIKEALKYIGILTPITIKGED